MMEEYNYWNDRRVIASMVSKPFKVVFSNEKKTKVELDECLLESLIDQDILPENHDGTIEAPTKYEVCGTCEGAGKVVNPSIDAGGISQEDFDEDPDFEERYKSGAFDITCPTCKGKRVEAIPQFPPAIAEVIAEWMRDEYEYARECARERAMGC